MPGAAESWSTVNRPQESRTASAPAFRVYDLLPDIILKNQDDLYVRISMEMTGRKLLLIICKDPSLPVCRAVLDACADAMSDRDPVAHVFAITATEPGANRAFLRQHPLPFMLLSDSLRHVARGLEIGHNLESDPGEGACTVVLADENRRVLQIERDLRDPERLRALVAGLTAGPGPSPRRLARFAPVLYVPHVLEPELCDALIRAYQGGDTEEGSVYSYDARGGDFVVDPEIKVRRDHRIADPGLLQTLRLRMERRVLPEIAKALTRQVTGIEEFKVVCYDGESGGHFKAHRDNLAKHMAHRRFAMTLNLNDSFEGGELRFPEYGPDLYGPAAGDAVVFSCSLLHEARPVTRGQRYVLLSFLFDEESLTLNERYRSRAGTKGQG